MRLPRFPLTLRWCRWPVALFASVFAGVFVWTGLPPRPRSAIVPVEAASEVLISGDGRVVLTQSFLDLERHCCTLQLWDSRTGALRTKIEAIRGISGPVWLSPDGSLLAATVATGSGETLPNYLFLWNALTGQEVTRFLANSAILSGNEAIRFSPDGKTLAFTSQSDNAGSTVNLWDVRGQRMRYVLKAQQGPLAFSPDSGTIATVTADSPIRIRQWDVATAAERAVLEQPRVPWKDELIVTGAIPHLAFSADGGSLGMFANISTADNDSKTTVKQAEAMFGTGAGPGSGQSVGTGTFSGGPITSRPVGRGLTDAPVEQVTPSNLVRVWNVQTGRLRTERLLPYSQTNQPQGNWNRWCDHSDLFWDGVLLAGDRKNNQSRESLLDPATGEQRISVPAEGVSGPLSSWMGQTVYKIRSSPCGEFVAVHEFGVTTAQKNWWQRALELRHLSNAPAGSQFATLGSEVRLHDGWSGQLLAKFDDQSFECFSPDGRLLATSANYGRTVNIWDLPPGPPWLAAIGAAACLLICAGILARPWRRLTIS